jgi:hypothetical protein
MSLRSVQNGYEEKRKPNDNLVPKALKYVCLFPHLLLLFVFTTISANKGNKTFCKIKCID